MNHIRETRRAGQRERASECVLADASVNIASTLDRQAAWIASRRQISAAMARTLAELHFGSVHSRASR